MITEIYNALIEANIPDASARILTIEIEKKLVDISGKIKENLVMENIIPIEKENIGIRAEIKYLGEKMESGFAETGRIFQMMNEKMERGFAETDRRFQMMNERMERGFAETGRRFLMMNEKMDRGFAETGRRFLMMNEKMDRGFTETDKRILMLNEQMNKRFAYMERLQLSMLGCLIALLVKFLFFNG